MRRYSLVIVLAVFVVFGCLYRAPWVQGRPGAFDDSSLGFAPVWSGDFHSFPDAHVDWRDLATHAALALAIVGLIGVGQSLRRFGQSGRD
jgi:hypothetical protein